VLSSPPHGGCSVEFPIPGMGAISFYLAPKIDEDDAMAENA